MIVGESCYEYHSAGSQFPLRIAPTFSNFANRLSMVMTSGAAFLSFCLGVVGTTSDRFTTAGGSFSDLRRQFSLVSALLGWVMTRAVGTDGATALMT